MTSTEKDPTLLQSESPPGAHEIIGSSTYRRSLTQTTLSGIVWLLAQNLGARVVGFVSQIILAKVLLPADFAGLGLAITITAIVGVLVNFGVDDVLLQRQKALRFWAMPALLASLGLGVVSMVAVLAVTPLAASMYRMPVLLSVLPIMAVSMPLGALSTVPTVQIRATLNFRLLAALGTMELLASQGFTILLAFWGFGVFSFVIPGPFIAVARAVIYWSFARPVLRPMRRRQITLMISKGTTVFGTKIIYAVIGQGDFFVLGLLASASAVGAYVVAFRLAVQPVQMLAGNLANVLFPALVQLQGDPVRQRDAALRACRILAFVAIPLGFLQAAVARPALTLIFGEKWQEAIPLLQLLSIGLSFDGVSWIAGSLLSARGEFRTSFRYAAAQLPCFFIFVIIGGIVGSNYGVAVGVMLYYIIIPQLYCYFVFREIGMSLIELTSLYLKPTMFSVIASYTGVTLSSYYDGQYIIQLFIISTIYFSITFLLTRVFDRVMYSTIKVQIFHFLRIY